MLFVSLQLLIKEISESKLIINQRTKFRTRYVTLPPEKEGEYQKMMKIYNENLEMLQSGDPGLMRSASGFFEHLFSFGRADLLYANQRMLSILCSVVFSIDDANCMASVMHALIGFLKLTGFPLSNEISLEILERINALSAPLAGLTKYASCLYLLLKHIISCIDEFELTEELIQSSGALLCLDPELDISMIRMIRKHQKYKYKESLNDMVFSFVKAACSSPFFQNSCCFIIKLMLTCQKKMTNKEDKAIIDNDLELIAPFISLWNISENLDILLFDLASATTKNATLIELMSNGGFDALIRSLQSESDNLIKAAFELLYTFNANNWICPFTIEEILPLTVSVIWKGSIPTKWAAGRFLARVAVERSSLFYESFLNSNAEDSNEDPAPDNYARAFAFLIEIGADNENKALADIFDGLYEIGRHFKTKNQVHEFKETLDYYEISDYTCNFTDSQDEDINEAAENFYYKCVYFNLD
jgi:hypothetical protein